MADFVKIQAIRLPSIYPTVDYIDLLNINGRIVRDDYTSVSAVTDKLFKTTDDSQYLKRPIQTILYNKYRLTFTTKENVDITQISYTELCYITTEQGEIHKAIFVDFKGGEFVDGKTTKTYTATYYDVSKDNYVDSKQPINNFLLSSELIGYGYSASHLWQLKLSTTRVDGSGNYIDSEYDAVSSMGRFSIYTKLEIEEVSESVNNYSNNKTKETLSQTVLYKKYAARFYLNESDKNIIERYTNAVESVCLGKDSTAYYSVSDITISAPDKDLAGVYEVNVTLTSEITYTNYAETSQLSTMSLGDRLRIVHDSTTYNYYTLITPDFDVDKDGVDDDLPTVKVRQKQINKDQVLITIFCNETNKNVLSKIAETSYTGSGIGAMEYTYDSVTYTCIEPCELEIEPVENAINLYKLTIKMNYDESTIYPYQS